MSIAERLSTSYCCRSHSGSTRNRGCRPGSRTPCVGRVRETVWRECPSSSAAARIESPLSWAAMTAAASDPSVCPRAARRGLRSSRSADAGVDGNALRPSWHGSGCQVSRSSMPTWCLMMTLSACARRCCPSPEPRPARRALRPCSRSHGHAPSTPELHSACSGESRIGGRSRRRAGRVRANVAPTHALGFRLWIRHPRTHPASRQRSTPP